MTLEEKADKYAFGLKLTDSPLGYFYEYMQKAYIAGATENGIVWHDLRKNPDDVPLIEGRYLCILDYGRTHSKPVVLMYADDRLGHFVWVADDDDIYDGCVSKWAEIPKFEDKL